MTTWQDYEALARTYRPTYETLYSDLEPQEMVDRFRSEIGDDPDELTFAFCNLHAIAMHAMDALAKCRAALCSAEYRARVVEGHTPDHDDDEVQEHIVKILDAWRDHADELTVRAALEGIDG